MLFSFVTFLFFKMESNQEHEHDKEDIVSLAFRLSTEDDQSLNQVNITSFSIYPEQCNFDHYNHIYTDREQCFGFDFEQNTWIRHKNAIILYHAKDSEEWSQRLESHHLAVMNQYFCYTIDAFKKRKKTKKDLHKTVCCTGLIPKPLDADLYNSLMFASSGIDDNVGFILFFHGPHRAISHCFANAPSNIILVVNGCVEDFRKHTADEITCIQQQLNQCEHRLQRIEQYIEEETADTKLYRDHQTATYTFLQCLSKIVPRDCVQYDENLNRSSKRSSRRSSRTRENKTQPYDVGHFHSNPETHTNSTTL